ncbi:MULTISPECIES: hypothetical protein [unclassified Streptomyces]|uniref:hypothetical protein n=1 Tax=unclassified Streptomyces TaxID=2593676 RepID=UPI002E29AB8A|nr:MULTISPECIES: hypothetical protein [unclassified Streptomyces]
MLRDPAYEQKLDGHRALLFTRKGRRAGAAVRLATSMQTAGNVLSISSGSILYMRRRPLTLLQSG